MQPKPNVDSWQEGTHTGLLQALQLASTALKNTEVNKQVWIFKNTQWERWRCFNEHIKFSEDKYTNFK